LEQTGGEIPVRYRKGITLAVGKGQTPAYSKSQGRQNENREGLSCPLVEFGITGRNQGARCGEGACYRTVDTV
jgi:hypothetical protein